MWYFPRCCHPPKPQLPPEEYGLKSKDRKHQINESFYHQGQKSWGHFCICGDFFSSHMPTPFPTPQTKLDVCIQNFFEFQHCVGWREGELQEHFAKDALFYEGIHKLQKIMNTALLSQALHPCFV